MSSIKDMSEKLESIEKKVDELMNALLGNPLTKDGGIVKRIETLEDKMAFWERVRWGAIVLLSVVGGFVIWLFDHLGELSAYLGRK